MILLSQWYEPKDKDRLSELKRARDSNESSGLFSGVVYVDGTSKRWTFADFFSLASQDFYGQPCVLANADIEFDDTIGILSESFRPKRIFALTKWDSPKSPAMLGHFIDGLFFSGTQDTWCFLGGHMPDSPPQIELGVVGCDQALLGWAVLGGCEVFDPAIDVRTWHAHDSQDRPQRNGASGLYAYPELTTIISSGLVATHPWPDGTLNFTIRHTCRL